MTAFRVALTFDVEFPDRPHEHGGTERLLDMLAQTDVRASVFIQGRWAEAEPRLARRIADAGHLIGNHSHHHARLTMLTASAIVRDALAAEAAIVAATGVSPRPWYRCPFGAGARTARVADRLAGIGYLDVGWDVDSRDWAAGNLARLEGRIIRATIARGDGAVVLGHGWPTGTPAAFRGAIGRLREAGASFVTLDELPDVPGRRSSETFRTPPRGTGFGGEGVTVTAGGEPVRAVEAAGVVGVDDGAGAVEVVGADGGVGAVGADGGVGAVGAAEAVDVHHTRSIVLPSP